MLSASVEGELTAETNGVPTKLTGSGSLLRWDLVDAERVLEDQPPVRAVLRRGSELLQSAGITLLIEEQGKPLVELGSTSSLLGRALFGSRSVRPRALLRLLSLARRTRR